MSSSSLITVLVIISIIAMTMGQAEDNSTTEAGDKLSNRYGLFNMQQPPPGRFQPFMPMVPPGRRPPNNFNNNRAPGGGQREKFKNQGAQRPNPGRGVSNQKQVDAPKNNLVKPVYEAEGRQEPEQIWGISGQAWLDKNNKPVQSGNPIQGNRPQGSRPGGSNQGGPSWGPVTFPPNDDSTTDTTTRRTATPRRSTTSRTTTDAPAIVTTTTTSPCERACPVTPEFNPVCTTDGVIYTNPGRLKCAQNCGKRVTLSHYGSCSQARTTRSPRTTPPGFFSGRR